MQSSLAVLGLMAAVAFADLPVPRTMCGVSGTPTIYGPLLCSIFKVPSEATGPVVFETGQKCTPAFCVDGGNINLCRTGTDLNTPMSVSWDDISNSTEAAFKACGGVTMYEGKESSTSNDAWWVQFQAFSYITSTYSVEIVGSANCDSASKSIQYKC